MRYNLLIRIPYAIMVAVMALCFWKIQADETRTNMLSSQLCQTIAWNALMQAQNAQITADLLQPSQAAAIVRSEEQFKAEGLRLSKGCP